jgi:hypothetical protein
MYPKLQAIRIRSASEENGKIRDLFCRGKKEEETEEEENELHNIRKHLQTRNFKRYRYVSLPKKIAIRFAKQRKQRKQIA